MRKERKKNLFYRLIRIGMFYALGYLGVYLYSLKGHALFFSFLATARYYKTSHTHTPPSRLRAPVPLFLFFFFFLTVRVRRA